MRWNLLGLLDKSLTEYEGYVPEGKFVSLASYVRSYVHAFAERLRLLWEGVSDHANQPFIPRKSPMIFRWHSNAAWNPREWITKRMNMQQRNPYWEEDELMAKVKKFADPIIEKKRWQAHKAKTLQDDLSALFEQNVRLLEKNEIRKRFSHSGMDGVYIYAYGVGKEFQMESPTSVY